MIPPKAASRPPEICVSTSFTLGSICRAKKNSAKTKPPKSAITRHEITSWQTILKRASLSMALPHVAWRARDQEPERLRAALRGIGRDGLLRDVRIVGFDARRVDGAHREEPGADGELRALPGKRGRGRRADLRECSRRGAVNDLEACEIRERRAVGVRRRRVPAHGC